MIKKIDGYDNYTIDDNGQVENIVTHKVLKGSIGEHGYKYYRLSKDGQKKMFYAHILTANAFIPNPNNLPVVNHIDGNKLNNSVNNLEWVSYSDNVEHAHSYNLISSVRIREYYKEDLEGEVWKKIFDYNYSISSYGRVRNDTTNLLLKPSIACGYYKVRLSYYGNVQDFMVHNLVYCIFNNTQIPQGYVVNHKNADKLDNRLDNLELITLSENVYAAYYKTKTNKSCKKVLQFDLNGKYITSFNSTREAGRELGLDASSISKVCRGVAKTCGGFFFKYEE